VGLQPAVFKYRDRRAEGHVARHIDRQHRISVAQQTFQRTPHSKTDVGRDITVVKCREMSGVQDNQAAVPDLRNKMVCVAPDAVLHVHYQGVDTVEVGKAGNRALVS
jgi:hypothetical protein